MNVCPLMKEAFSEARNSAHAPMSPGTPILLTGIPEAISASSNHGAEHIRFTAM